MPSLARRTILGEARLAGEKAAAVATAQVVSASAGETRRLGRCLGALLRPGDLLLLAGPFGAGKTTLTQGSAHALGVREPVTSPSFTLVNQYRGADRRRGPVLYHVDLFRIGSAAEAFDLGLEEYLAGGPVCVIEWPQQAAPFLPEERLEIRMAFLGDTGRLWELVGRGTRYFSLVRQFVARCAPLTMGAEEARGGR